MQRAQKNPGLNILGAGLDLTETANKLTCVFSKRSNAWMGEHFEIQKKKKYNYGTVLQNNMLPNIGFAIALQIYAVSITIRIVVSVLL